MRLIRFVLFASVLAAATPAAGQVSTPAIEIFGGYSLLPANGDDFPRQTSHGFQTSVTANLNRWFGVVGDFGWQFNTATDLGPNFQGQTAKSNVREYLVGPRFTARSAGADFIRTEAAGGIALVAAAVVALVWANSPWDVSYQSLWNTDLSIGGASHSIDLTLNGWVNEALMTIFFCFTRVGSSGSYAKPRTWILLASAMLTFSVSGIVRTEWFVITPFSETKRFLIFSELTTAVSSSRFSSVSNVGAPAATTVAVEPSWRWDAFRMFSSA